MLLFNKEKGIPMCNRKVLLGDIYLRCMESLVPELCINQLFSSREKEKNALFQRT